MDDNRSGTLDFAEFAKGVQETKLDITVPDLKLLYAAFDRNGDGTINYDEFLRSVRGELSENRLALVKRAFEVLDKDGSGEIDYKDICNTYNAKKHSAVLDGRKTEK